MIQRINQEHKQTGTGEGIFGFELSSMVGSADHCHVVYRSNLNAGDLMFVRTVKSIYRIRFCGEGQYEVSGGWFERKGDAAVRIGITGCTWGGSAIKIDLIAACGLRIEFGNRLVTSPVQKFFVLHQFCQN